MIHCSSRWHGAGDTEEEGEELGRAARTQRPQGVQAAPPATGYKFEYCASSKLFWHCLLVDINDSD